MVTWRFASVFACYLCVCVCVQNESITESTARIRNLASWLLVGIGSDDSF